MESVQKTDRLLWIDTARGIGMLLVIWSHLSEGPETGWMYSFHLPLFFVISGFLFSARRSFPDFLRRRLKTLVIPYFCLAVPLAAFYIWHESPPEGTAGVLLALLVQRRSFTLWYPACLFLLELLAYGLTVWLRTPEKTAAVSVLLGTAGLLYVRLGGQPVFWNADACLTAMPFFAAGMLLRKHYSRICHILSGWRGAAAFGILMLLNISGWLLNRALTGEHLDFFWNQFELPLLTYPAAFAGACAVLLLCHRVSSRVLRYIGSNSLIYMAWHQTILIPAVYILFVRLGVPEELTGLPLVLEDLAKLAVMCAVLAVCNEIIVRTPLRFAVGK